MNRILSFVFAVIGVFVLNTLVVTSVQAQDTPVEVKAGKGKKSKRIKKKKTKGDKVSKRASTSRGIESRKSRRSRRVYPQPDPYAGRKVRPGQARKADKAGPPPDLTFRKPPRGERPGRSEISGRKRIRTQSKRSDRRTTYPQTSPYKGREQRSAERASSVRKTSPYKGREQRSAERASRRVRGTTSGPRSASVPAESRKTVRVPPPASASGQAKITRKKRPYAGKERRPTERATNKDIAGRKLRTRNTNSIPKKPLGQYIQANPYKGRKSPKEGERFSKSRTRQTTPSSITRSSEDKGRRRQADPVTKDYRSPRSSIKLPSFDPYKGRKKTDERRRLSRTPQTAPRSISRKSERRIPVFSATPRSASANRKLYKQRKTYANKEQRRGERSTNRDIAGRRLRTRNKVSPRPQWGGAIGRPDTYYGRKDRGDRASKALPGSGARSISGQRWNNRGYPIASKPPGQNAIRASKFGGQGIRPIKGGGSISGQHWNNNGYPIASRPPGKNAIRASKFGGKGVRPIKGGGSISGQLWNNNGFPIASRPPSKQQIRASKFQGRFLPIQLKPGLSNQKAIARYQGNIPGSRPIKGGGSISGQLWNNNGFPIAGRPPSREQIKASKFQGRYLPSQLKPGLGNQRAIARYQGNIPGSRPIKGGGSISGRLWNNNGLPIAGSKAPTREAEKAAKFKGRFYWFELQPSLLNDARIARYQGNIPAEKPLKGGGSISGKLWNNNGKPIPSRRPPSKESEKAAKFQGRFYWFELQPSLLNDARIAKYQGNIKAKRPRKGGGGSISGKLWNNNGEPIARRLPTTADAAKMAKYQGNVKSDKSKPPRTDVGNLKSVVGWTPLKARKYKGFVKNTTIPIIDNNKPERTDVGNVKSVIGWKPLMARKYGAYVRSTSVPLIESSKPTRTDVGNVKTVFFYKPKKVKEYNAYLVDKPFDFLRTRKQMHPSYAFNKTGDNAAAEKDKTFKFKIWWASIFGKNQNQPKSVKQSPKRPRYDKNEIGLWYN